MEITQIILVAVVVILTAILTLVGVEVFLVLKEFRESVRKANKVLDDLGLISSSVAKPVASFSSMVEGLRGFADLLQTWLGSVEEKKVSKAKLLEEENENGASPSAFEDGGRRQVDKEETAPVRIRRFFTRRGKRVV